MLIDGDLYFIWKLHSYIYTYTNLCYDMDSKKIFIIFLMHVVVCYSSSLAIDNINTLTCNIPLQEALNRFMHTETQKKIASEWSSTHDVQNFEASEWQKIDRSEVIDTNQMKKYNVQIPLHSVIFTSNMGYSTRINLPFILRKLIKTHYTFDISKTIYVVGGVIHSFSEILNVPIIGHVNIYSKSQIKGGRHLMSRTSVIYGGIPWYLKWTEPHVKHEMDKSVDLNNALIAKHMCV